MKLYASITSMMLFSSALIAADDIDTSQQDAEALAEVAPALSNMQAPESAAQPALVPSVTRASFTSGIESREPVDELQSTDSQQSTVYFFSELKNLSGHTVMHRWKYMDKTMAEVSFDVAGNRWRVNSSKNLMPEWLGTWQVEVVDQSGDVLASYSMEYTAAAATETPVQ